MSKQIVKYADKYLVFSTTVDDILIYDATEEEIIEYFMEEAAERAKRNTLEVLDKLKHGASPYYQFTKDLNAVFETIAMVHGKEVALDRKNEILGTNNEEKSRS